MPAFMECCQALQENIFCDSHQADNNICYYYLLTMNTTVCFWKPCSSKIIKAAHYKNETN